MRENYTVDDDGEPPFFRFGDTIDSFENHVFPCVMLS